MSDSTYLERILHYACSWRVFPCRDKRPLTAHGLKDATQDQDKIREWWGKWPNAQLGVPVGMNTGSFVLDVDLPNGPATLAQLENIHGKLPATWKARTPSGGLHLHFRLPEGVTLKNTASVLGEGLDIRTEGGYIIAAPSPGYAWLTNGTRLAPAPEWLLRLLTTPPEKEECKITRAGSTTAYGRKALENECALVALAAVGQRNNVLNIAALKIGQLVAGGQVEQSEAESCLLHAADRAGLTEAESRKTILSGFNAGLDQPREIQANKRELEFVTTVTESAISSQPSQNRPFRHSRPNSSQASHGVTDTVTPDGENVTGQPPSMSEALDQFIEFSSGMFTISEVSQWLGITTPVGRDALRQALLRRIHKSKIERVGTKSGQFRRVEGECSALDFLSDEGAPVDISLPFGLNKLVDTMPGNIVLVAGESNSGKTAFMLNVVRENMHKFETHYFSSEMGPQEMKARLKMFNQPLDSWTFYPWERADNFHDVIRPGEGVINIIDYLEVNEDFYRVGMMLKSIHDKLKGAVAVVALQKPPGRDIGRGGAGSLDKPRLYLALEPGVIKIVKGKNWKDIKVNPNNLQRTFKLVGGCNFLPQDEWHPSPPREEKQGARR
jgi:putative DNA primase/helicase